MYQILIIHLAVDGHLGEFHSPFNCCQTSNEHECAGISVVGCGVLWAVM